MDVSFLMEQWEDIYTYRNPAVDIKDCADISDSWYINRYLWLMAQEEGLKFHELKPLLTLYIDKTVNSVHKIVNSVFPCKCIPVGSSYENTQVGLPLEYDFLLELTDIKEICRDPDEIDITTAEIQSTKPQEEGVLKPQTYLNLFCTNDSKSTKNSEWQKGHVDITHEDNINTYREEQIDCYENQKKIKRNQYPWGEFGKKNDPNTLDPQKIHLALGRKIETAFGTVKYAGPAVSVYLVIAISCQKQSQDFDFSDIFRNTMQTKNFVIKIDFVFGIPVECMDVNGNGMLLTLKTGTHKTWKLSNIKTTKHGRNIKDWHLVLSWNYWQLSCSTYDSTLVKILCSTTPQMEAKRMCFVAAKQLRNLLDITDDYEINVLSTYPIKMAFIKECLNEHNIWNKSSIAKNVMKIFEVIYADRGKSQMESPFVKDHPVLTVGDKSYLEAKRVILYLKNINKWYHRKVLINGIYIFVYLAILTMQFFVHKSYSSDIYRNETCGGEQKALFALITLFTLFLDYANWANDVNTSNDLKFRILSILYKARLCILGINFCSLVFLSPTVPQVYVTLLGIVCAIAWIYFGVCTISHYYKKGIFKIVNKFSLVEELEVALFTAARAGIRLWGLDKIYFWFQRWYCKMKGAKKHKDHMLIYPICGR